MDHLEMLFERYFTSLMSEISRAVCQKREAPFRDAFELQGTLSLDSRLPRSECKEQSPVAIVLGLPARRSTSSSGVRSATTVFRGAGGPSEPRNSATEVPSSFDKMLRMAITLSNPGSFVAPYSIS